MEYTLKNFIAYVGLLLLTACNPAVESMVNTPASQINDRFDQVGAMVYERDGKYRAYCSGVFLGEIFLTAAHCVSDDTGYVAEDVLIATHRSFDSEQATFAKAWLFHPRVVLDTRDVALLVPDDRRAKLAHGVARLAAHNVDFGDGVDVYGHPRGYLYYFSTGQVVTPLRYLPDGQGNEMPFTMINAQAYPGMSGGPVFNKEGRVVGLTSFGWYGQQNLVGTVTRDSIALAIGVFRSVGGLEGI